MDTKTLLKLQEIAAMRNEQGYFIAFDRLLKSFGVWACMGAGVPKYHCPLNRGSDVRRDENGERIFPVSDTEADILNAVIAQIMLFNRVGFALFKAIYVFNLPLSDVKDSKFFRRLFRLNRLPFDDDAIIDLLEAFNERVRVKLLSLDTKEQNKKGAGYGA